MLGEARREGRRVAALDRGAAVYVHTRDFGARAILCLPALLPAKDPPVSGHIRNYWDYDRNVDISCGWAGPAREGEGFFEQLLDVRCPECDRALFKVLFPTSEETRAAAAAGNPRAQAELTHLDARESFLERAARLELKKAAHLPDLDGDRLVIDWDFDDRDAEKWTVLRHGGKEVWRELAYYEGYERFAAVFKLLRERYGSRLAEVRPTPASATYLYGDTWASETRASKTINRLNASLSGRSHGRPGSSAPLD